MTMLRFTLKAWLLVISLVICNSAWAQLVELDVGKKYYIQSPALIYTEDHSVDSNELEGLTIPEKSQLKAATAKAQRTSIWYRFDLSNQTKIKTWSIDVTNTLVSKVTVHAQSGSQHSMTHNGYMKRIPFDLSNGARITLPPNSNVSIWLNLQAPYIAKNPLISLQPLSQYSHSHFIYNALVLLALGAMLALAFYNTFLYFPTRDPSFLWFALYQLLCCFGWAAHFKLLLYGFDIEMEQSTFYLPFYIACATSLMFAVSFLRLHARNKITLGIEAFSIAIIVFGVIGLALPFKYYYFSVGVVAYLWMAVMLLVGIRRLRSGFRPARFFVVGFSIMTAFFVFTLAGSIAGLDLFDNTLVWAFGHSFLIR